MWYSTINFLLHVAAQAAVTSVVKMHRNKHWCKPHEDGSGAETCRSKLILKCITYRLVHLLMLNL